ncbi:anti-sigma factor family protein [Labrys monachus]|uniref:Anti-sigma factor RsiW n=1 Tax=Labrys monachus TaxID=217067 RepID=A0ABU0FJG2_9HYPH|nr:anti-sigma factor [Labrys monachus]MDQ0394750.1 anti-sigma factor RsiW [Labrys monachus]
MSTQRPVTEDDLQAYVDDVLAPAERRRIEAYLDQHPDVAQRIGDYAGQRDALRQVLGGIAAEPVPPELSLAGLIEAHQLREREARKAGAVRRSDWRQAAAGLALLFAGGGAGWALHGVEAAPTGGAAVLAQEAADSYAVYAPDHVRPVELKAEASAELVNWVSGRLRHPVSVPDLSQAGYRFMGGRLVATAHGPAALFLYDDDRGTRLAMLVRPMAIDKDMPMSEHAMGTTGGVAWAEKGIGYSLVGSAPASALHPLADQVRRQIDGDA